jgi:hypothetical protein
MGRRPAAWAGAILLLAEALGIICVNAVLAVLVHNQHMSLAGLDPDAITLGAWLLGGVFALCLAACAAVLLRVAVKARAPGRAGRIVLIVCAVVHGVLGAVTAGLVGWPAFAFMMVVLGLLVLVLLADGDSGRGSAAQPPETAEMPSSPAGPPVAAA